MSDIPSRKKKPSPNKGGQRSPNLNGPDKQIISAAVAEKRVEALELRKNGMSYHAIAAQMGLSTPMVAWRYVNDAIAAIPKEKATELRRIHIEDANADLLRLNKRIREEKLTVSEFCKALSAKVKARDQLAKLLGLYAPTRAEVTGKDGAPLTITTTDIRDMTDEQLERAIANANRRSSAGGDRAGTSSTAPREAGEAH